MNVALFCIHSSPLARLGSKEAGGMNVYVRELATELGKQEVHVDIFTRLQSPETPRVVTMAPGVRVVHFPAGEAAPCDKYHIIAHLPSFVDEVCGFAHAERCHYDVIHSHYWISGAAALMLRTRWQIPLVQMFHTLGALKNCVARSTEEQENTTRMAIEQQLIRDADVVVASTPQEYEQMQHHYHTTPQAFVVIPGGVNHNQLYPMEQAHARHTCGIAADALVCVCIGRMEPLKGMDHLLRAVALLHQRVPAWQHRLQVVFVGGGDETSPDTWNNEQRRLAALRDALGIRHAVRFAGTQPHNELVHFYGAADVCVIPSHYETFGLVALEAQACARCVIASDVGGLPYIVTHGVSGMLVPPGDAEQLANELACVLSDDTYRARLAQQAYQQATQRSWHTTAQQTIALYKQST